MTGAGCKLPLERLQPGPDVSLSLLQSLGTVALGRPFAVPREGLVPGATAETPPRGFLTRRAPPELPVIG